MPLRVCYFGTYRRDYSRNRILIEGLRQNGVEVLECHRQLWRGIKDRVSVAGGNWWRPEFLKRLFSVYWRLLADFRRLDDFDVLVLGYPGHLDAPLARVLSWLRRKPLVMDVFMSPYLVAMERGLTQAHPLTGQLLLLFEGLVYRLPDRLVQDTKAYVHWLQGRFALDPRRFRLVSTGADDSVFKPTPSKSPQDSFLVIYYGTFIPNHGVMHILEAARLLQGDSAVRFELIGNGPELSRAQAFADEHRLTNVCFVDWLSQTDLVDKAGEAAVCLGAFGTTPQSMMTIQNKIYECLAMGKTLITGDSETVRQAFEDRRHLYLVKRASGAAIARAIQDLHRHPELAATIAQEGLVLFQDRFTQQALGKRFREHLIELIMPATQTH